MSCGRCAQGIQSAVVRAVWSEKDFFSLVRGPLLMS